MTMWKKIVLFTLAVMLVSCGNKKPVRIAYDPSWYGVGASSMTSDLNGFTEDLLLTFSKQAGVIVEKHEVNAESLIIGLQQGDFDAIITTTVPYTFYRKLYDFSKPVLQTGLVKLEKKKPPFAYTIYGMIERAGLYDDFMLKEKDHLVSYASAVKLLEALDEGHVDAALLSYMQSVAFLNGSFDQSGIKLIMPPMGKEGIRMAVRHKKNWHLLRTFNRITEKKDLIKKLLEKWQLVVKE
jgi:ABC-type amino acid transport substrate-binding protein